MRATEREKLERMMLRQALKAAREALQAFPVELVDKLPKGRNKSKATMWLFGLRNPAICEISAILGDVPLAQLDVRKPPPFRPVDQPARSRERLNDLKRQLGLPKLEY